eukprot:scaffold2192_cov200-Alexandrium_tamarense.AAC.17
MASSAASVSNESQDVSEVDSSTANGRIDAVRELARVVSVRNGLTNAAVVVSHDRKISKSSMETEATTTAGSEVPMPMTKNKNSFFIDATTDATATLKIMEKSTDLSDANISGDAADTTLGRWTAEEHEQFLHGMKVYGREWKKVAQHIPTRSAAQIRSHAQKFFAKMSREQQPKRTLDEKQPPSSQDNATSNLIVPRQNKITGVKSASCSYIDTVNSILEHPKGVESRVTNALISLRERYKHLESHMTQTNALSANNAKSEGIKRSLTMDSFQLNAKSANTSALSLGPASAALAKEQQTLRKAAEARYKMKKRQSPSPNSEQRDVLETSRSSCARVSLASMPSRGRFDSSQVIALSMLGGSFDKDRTKSNITVSTDKSSQSTSTIHEQITDGQRPSKLRKTEH